MVDKDKIAFLFSELDKYLDDLEEMKKLSRNTFLEDTRNIYSLRYLFQITIETSINIGTHIISSYRLGLPKEYSDVFRILKNNHIISEDIQNRLILMTRFRNRLVHIYWDIDDETIFKYLQENLEDFYAYKKEISSYLKK